MVQRTQETALAGTGSSVNVEKEVEGMVEVRQWAWDHFLVLVYFPWLGFQSDYRSSLTEEVEDCLDDDLTWLKKIARNHGAPLEARVDGLVAGLEAVSGPSEGVDAERDHRVCRVLLGDRGAHPYHDPSCFENVHQSRIQLYTAGQVSQM